MSDHGRRSVLRDIGLGTAALVGSAGAASAQPGRRGAGAEKTIVEMADELGLAYMRADSYRQTRSKYTLGVVMFSLFLLGRACWSSTTT
jgi:hypothetical protein